MGKKLLLMGLLTSSLVWATDYALIVGISDYSNQVGFNNFDEKKMTNEMNYYQTLLTSHGIEKNNIKYLKNKNKTFILEELDFIKSQLENTQNTKNRFYMFFIGHGMDIHNSEYQMKLGLTYNAIEKTGAIVPYGFNENKPVETLIVGSLDLRNRFAEIDNHVSTGLIVFNACFSDKTSRDNKTQKRKNLIKNINHNDNGTYPYTNITYIGSSMIQAELGKFPKECLTQKTSNLIKECLDGKRLSQKPVTYFNNNKNIFSIN